MVCGSYIITTMEGFVNKFTWKCIYCWRANSKMKVNHVLQEVGSILNILMIFFYFLFFLFFFFTTSKMSCSLISNKLLKYFLFSLPQALAGVGCLVIHAQQGK